MRRVAWKHECLAAAGSLDLGGPVLGAETAELFFLTSWRLEVLDPGVGRAALARLGSSPCVLTRLSLCMFLNFSHQDTRHTRSGPILVTSFYLHYLPETPSANTVMP